MKKKKRSRIAKNYSSARNDESSEDKTTLTDDERQENNAVGLANDEDDVNEIVDEEESSGNDSEYIPTDNDYDKAVSADDDSVEDQSPPVDNEQGIERLRVQLKESNDKVLRTRAEFENYRKRTQREMSELRSIAKISTIEEVLPVLDHFKMAMSASDNSDDLETLKEGMKLILVEFDRCLSNLGVDTIKTEGEAFDPNIHEAVSSETSDEIEEGFVIREWKSGYRIGERIVRPATVVVSSGPETDESNVSE